MLHELLESKDNDLDRNMHKVLLPMQKELNAFFKSKVGDAFGSSLRFRGGGGGTAQSDLQDSDIRANLNKVVAATFLVELIPDPPLYGRPYKLIKTIKEERAT